MPGGQAAGVASGRSFLAVLASIGFAACGGPDAQPEPRSSLPLTAALSDSVDVPVLVLSHTLEEVAAGQTSVEVLQPDLLVGETDDEHAVWFEGLGDVASLGAGAFAVLDPLQAHVSLIDSLGRRTGTLGRRGDGPGEFRDPWAVATVGALCNVFSVKVA